MGYIERLKAETLRQKEDQALVKRPTENPRIMEDWEPLTIQIEKIMLCLPPVLKAGPFSLDFFQSKICGKYKPTVSAGDLGLALTSLGFSRKRDYSKNGNGRRFWWPPSKD